MILVLVSVKLCLYVFIYNFFLSPEVVYFIQHSMLCSFQLTVYNKDHSVHRDLHFCIFHSCCIVFHCAYVHSLIQSLSTSCIFGLFPIFHSYTCNSESLNASLFIDSLVYLGINTEIWDG